MAIDPDPGPSPVPFPIRTDFATPIAALVDLERFIEYHAWALSTLMGVTARMAADRPWYSHLERGWLCVDVVVAPIIRLRHPNPSNSWFFRFAYIESLEKCILKHPEFGRNFITENTDTGLALEGCSRLVYVPHHPERLLLPETRGALEDLFDLLQFCINHGIVLRPISRGETSAEPGALRPVTSKSKTIWEWTPLLDTLDDVYENFKKSGFTPKRTLSVEELMAFSAALRRHSY